MVFHRKFLFSHFHVCRLAKELFCKSLSGAQAGGGISNLGHVLLVVQEPKLLEGQAGIDVDR